MFLLLFFHVAHDLSLFVSGPLDWIWRVNPYSCECHASIGNWKVNISRYIVSANICNYNRRCISSFICVRFTRDLEADRWEWPDPFCNQTASICFPYNTTTHPSGITHPVVSNYNHRHPSGTGWSFATAIFYIFLTGTKKQQNHITQSFLSTSYIDILIFWGLTMVRWKKSCLSRLCQNSVMAPYCKG